MLVVIPVLLSQALSLQAPEPQPQQLKITAERPGITATSSLIRIVAHVVEESTRARTRIAVRSTLTVMTASSTTSFTITAVNSTPTTSELKKCAAAAKVMVLIPLANMEVSGAQTLILTGNKIRGAKAALLIPLIPRDALATTTLTLIQENCAAPASMIETVTGILLERKMSLASNGSSITSSTTNTTWNMPTICQTTRDATDRPILRATSTAIMTPLNRLFCRPTSWTKHSQLRRSRATECSLTLN